MYFLKRNFVAIDEISLICYVIIHVMAAVKVYQDHLHQAGLWACGNCHLITILIN